MLYAVSPIANAQSTGWQAQRDAEIREQVFRQNERISRAQTADEVLRLRSNRDVMIRAIKEKWESRQGDYIDDVEFEPYRPSSSKYTEHLFAKTPEGNWTATIATTNGALLLHLVIVAEAQGRYAGQIAEPTQRIVVGLTNTSHENEKAISFFVPALRARFAGDLIQPPKRSMVGLWEANGTRTQITWLPQPKTIDLTGFRFADEQLRADYCAKAGFEGGTWDGTLARGGKNSSITIRLGRCCEGTLTDWHFRISGIPIADVTVGATNISFAVPAFKATCHLIREPANGMMGFWESRGRRDAISFTHRPQAKFVAPETVPLTHFSRVTREALEFANTDFPAASYEEAIRVQNPYFLCSICTKAWHKKTMHEVTKGPCDGSHLRNPLYGPSRMRK